MTRKIIQLAGPLAQYAVCDDGTVWTWYFTGLTGRWQPWDRPPIPQPEPVLMTAREVLAKEEAERRARTPTLPAEPAAKDQRKPSGATQKPEGRR